ncbi:PAS domain-containing protein, partial [bacterium]|nr:PAS domain-containing protein [bacterium]
KTLAANPENPELITHGICDQCSESFSRGDQENFQSFLDDFHFPVIVVDEDGKVLGGNCEACNLTGKTLDQFQNQMLAGEAIDCVHSYEPGGCGHTIHCQTCTIRQSINQTFMTGLSLRNVPAYKDIRVGENEQPVRFLITTEKIKDRVLLRIDDLQK